MSVRFIRPVSCVREEARRRSPMCFEAIIQVSIKSFGSHVLSLITKSSNLKTTLSHRFDANPGIHCRDSVLHPVPHRVHPFSHHEVHAPAESPVVDHLERLAESTTWFGAVSASYFRSFSFFARMRYCVYVNSSRKGCFSCSTVRGSTLQPARAEHSDMEW